MDLRYLGIILLALITSNLSYAEPPILRVSLETEPTTLIWNQAVTSVDRFLASLLMRGLLRSNSQNQLECDLCQTYQVSSDQRTYTFVLKPQEKWSDGTPLKAEHFLSPLQNQATIQNVSSENEHTLKVVLHQPTPRFLRTLTLPHSYPTRPGIKKRTPTLGPYVLAEWVRGRRIVLEGNPNYISKRPVYRVELIFGKHRSLVEKFKKGRIDVLGNPTTEDAIQLQSQGAKMAISPYWATRILGFNFKKEPLQKRAIRKAISLSLDRKHFPVMLQNGEKEVTGIFPPGVEGYQKDSKMEKNLGKAKSMRFQVYPQKDHLEFTLLCRNTKSEKKIAEWISKQLQPLGITIRVVSKKSSAFVREIQKGSFDLLLYTWIFETGSPHDLLETLVANHPQNFWKWNHPTHDATQLKTPTQRDPQAREAFFQKSVEFIQNDEVVVIPIGFPIQAFLLNRRVERFEMTPSGFPNLPQIELKH